MDSRSIENMRKKISDQYPGPNWKDRVSRMDNAQVIAIYYNMERSGAFSKPKTLRKGKKESYRQMTVFDYI